MVVLRVMAGVCLKLITELEGASRFLELPILKKACELLDVEFIWIFAFLFLDLLLIILGDVGLSCC